MLYFDISMVSLLMLLISQDFLIINACLLFHMKFSIDFSALPSGPNVQEILMLFEVVVTNRDAVWHFCFATSGDS